MIIFRYLAKEVYSTLLASTLVLLLVLTSNQFIHYLTQAAAGVIPLRTVMQMMSLQLPLLLPILLPLGLYLGILMGYGRLYAEREMTVLSACGFSKAQLIGMTLTLAAVVAIVIAILTLWIQPISEEYKRQVLIDAATTSPMERLFAGKFQSLGDKNKLVFYAENLSRDHKRLENIFAAQPPQKEEDGWMIVKAATGEQMLDTNSGDKFIVLHQGYRYQGKPGRADFQVLKFDSYGIRIQQDSIPGKDRVEALSTGNLWQKRNDGPAYLAELQWRFSLPLSVFILALIALPLSVVNPRQGRFAQLLPAAILYIGYANLSFAGKAWLEKGQIPSYLGLWWLQLLMFLLAMILVFRFIGWRRVFFWVKGNNSHENFTSTYRSSRS